MNYKDCDDCKYQGGDEYCVRGFDRCYEDGTPAPPSDATTQYHVERYKRLRDKLNYEVRWLYRNGFLSLENFNENIFEDNYK